MKTFLIRGVPAGLQQDGWWLNAPQTPTPAPQVRGCGAQMGRLVILAALIALGDALIWQVVPGVSLAVFGALLVLAAVYVAVWAAGRRVAPQTGALCAGGTALALLPLVEMVNPLSFAVALSGISVVLCVVAGLRGPELWRGALRLWPVGVRQTVLDSITHTRIDGQVDVPGALGRLAMAWLMPLVLGLVFLALLLAANPVADRWLMDIARTGLRLPEPVRIGFWLCLVPLAWTVLSLRGLQERLRAAPLPAHMGPARLGLINPTSVTRALLVFNLLFAAQTVLDIVYLYGGLGLPEGITYAQYAHRGAYPLVVTGLLAGGFALMTRAWVQGDAVLRGLLMLFVAQNVALVVSSLVRLEMYVGHYGLTHLRVAAGIWMGLTAAGLALILWQIAGRYQNTWLVLRGSALTAVVLYVCAWVPFDAVIARHNLNHQERRSVAYVCALGDAAKPLVRAHELHTGRPICTAKEMHIRTPKDWREWGWRNARARSSFAALTTEPTP